MTTCDTDCVGCGIDWRTGISVGTDVGIVGTGTCGTAGSPLGTGAIGPDDGDGTVGEAAGTITTG